MHSVFVLVDGLVFVLVDELVFVLIDGIVLELVQVLGLVLVEALVCVPVEQHFCKSALGEMKNLSCVNLRRAAVLCSGRHERNVHTPRD